MRLALLLLTPAALVAQAAEVPLAQRLQTERPEVERLMGAFEVKEALAKAEALLPAQLPTWDKKDGQTQYKSYFLMSHHASAYFLAHRAAWAAGQREKALDYAKKAQACMVENAKNTAELFPKIAEAYQALADRSRATLKTEGAYIAELREKLKATPDDAGIKQQLEAVAKEEVAIADNEKWAGNFKGYVEEAKKKSGIYDPFVESADLAITSETTQIAEYKAGKGEKEKWVEAIAANPAWVKTNYPEQDKRMAFLFRLAVLAPENEKVAHLIDVELGKAPAKPEPAKGKGKGRGKR